MPRRYSRFEPNVQPAQLVLGDGRSFPCEVTDASMGGVGIRVYGADLAEDDFRTSESLTLDGEDGHFAAKLMSVNAESWGIWRLGLQWLGEHAGGQRVRSGGKEGAEPHTNADGRE